MSCPIRGLIYILICEPHNIIHSYSIYMKKEYFFFVSIWAYEFQSMNFFKHSPSPGLTPGSTPLHYHPVDIVNSSL